MLKKKVKSLFNKNSLISNAKGISLAEALVTAFIFFLLSSALYGVLVAGDQFWNTNRARIEVQRELRKAIDWMKDDLRQASDVSIINCPVGTSTCAAIGFKTPTGVSSGAIVWDLNPIAFYLGGSDLIKLHNGVKTILASDISSLNFDHSTADEIVITVQAQQDAVQAGETIDLSLDYTVNLRN